MFLYGGTDNSVLQIRSIQGLLVLIMTVIIILIIGTVSTLPHILRAAGG